MGRHRRRRRRRPDRALPLLRVQAALPVRDHGAGDRELPAPASRRITAAGADPRRGADRRHRRLSSTLDEHDVQRNRVLVAEQGLLAGPSSSPREEEARMAARARTRDARVRLGQLPRRRDAARARSRSSDPRLHDARDPRPLQQHLALVPAERDRRARPRRGVLHRPQPRDARRARPRQPGARRAAA